MKLHQACTCPRDRPHPGHRWMVGRKSFQCPGRPPNPAVVAALADALHSVLDNPEAGDWDDPVDPEEVVRILERLGRARPKSP